MAGIFKRLSKPKANVAVSLDTDEVNYGEDLTGILRVASSERLDVAELRADIKVEHTPFFGWEWYARILSNRVTGPFHLEPRDQKEFPFAITIVSGPKVLDPYRAVRNTLRPERMFRLDKKVLGNVKWSLKGIIGVKKRPDVTSIEKPFRVITPPPDTPIQPHDIVYEAYYGFLF